MPNSYIGKMATILWLQPLWAHRDKIPQYCNSTWKPMSESSSAIKRYGNRYSDKLYPNTCCLFLDAYCVGKHQILRKSSNFHKIPLINHWIFRKISYLCPKIEVFFAYCKIQKRAEVRSFPYCYLYNIGKRPTSWFSIKVQFRASFCFIIATQVIYWFPAAGDPGTLQHVPRPFECGGIGMKPLVSFWRNLYGTCPIS